MTRPAPLTCDAVIGGKPGAFVRCGQPAVEIPCGFCDVVAGACSRGHWPGAEASLQGHRLLHHPEKVPDLVREITLDQERREVVFEGELRDPRRWLALASAVRAAMVTRIKEVPRTDRGETLH